MKQQSMVIKCRYHQQIWFGDVPYTTPNKWDFDVTWPVNAAIPEDDTYESDDLLHLVDHIPDWILQHSGPFFVEILNRSETD